MYCYNSPYCEEGQVCKCKKHAIEEEYRKLEERKGKLRADRTYFLAMCWGVVGILLLLVLLETLG
jgi:hypothetical protein